MSRVLFGIIIGVSIQIHAMDQSPERSEVSIAKTLELTVQLAAGTSSLEPLRAILQKIKDGNLNYDVECKQHAQELQQKLDDGLYKYHREDHRAMIQEAIKLLKGDESEERT